ncbi:MAG: aminofutalosine synthase MqnE [Anaerolineae bacterium]|nr:aminofutalosine synthase MqnE [Caldilineales bacterium]MCX7852191.1 aminofutalosine synthase MqnE [Caldilineales bacterium]MDW8267582.1 aminofutalosine synthase MqnE [Anaerolineae bacterium]
MLSVLSPTRTDDLRDLVAKVEAGERLDFDDGVRLFRSHDLLTIGQMADQVNRRLNGGQYVYFNQNRHINPTNVCAFHCNFCSFARPREDSPGAYTWTPEEIVERIRPDVHPRVTEFHIVGGLHPRLGFDYYENILRALKAAYPWVHLKAFTAVEIDFFAQLTGWDHETVLRRLMAAGLGSMPGGGAEIFHPEVRRRICPEKADADTWLSIHRTAHRLGLHTNATMLYGHIERYEHRVDHLLRLRALQDETGGFQTFIPLRYHPENNNLGRQLDWTTAHDTLKTLAVSRILLDNFPHIKAYWIMLTPPIAQLALHFGADDIDGTVVEEKIYHEAGATTEESLDKFDLLRLIKAVGKIPVERDTLYNIIEIYDKPIEYYAPPSRKTARGQVKITRIELN